MKALAVYLVAVLFSLSAVQADDVTPSHVYQVANTAVRELQEVLSAKKIKRQHLDLEASPRRPRHVLQKAREVFVKLQNIRLLLNLPPIEVPPLSVGRIAPVDVKIQTNRILDAVRELYQTSGKKTLVDLVRFRSGKTPTDVYAQMAQISSMLDELQETAVKPSDVFRFSVTVKQVLEEIYKIKMNGALPSYEIAPVTGKSPRDVFQLGRVLHAKLEVLEAKHGYNIDGGVGEVKAKAGRVTPSDVLDLMNIILADVNAMKLPAGVQHVTQLPAYEGRKTPSDVFQEISKSIYIVDALL